MPQFQGKRPASLPMIQPILPPDACSRDEAIGHVVSRMRLNPLSNPSSPRLLHPKTPVPSQEFTSLLSDELLLLVFSKLHESQYSSNSLVCKRWLSLHGRLVRSLKPSDWDFVDSGRIVRRFPNLVEVDLVRACIRSPLKSGVLVTHRFVSADLDSRVSGHVFLGDDDFLAPSLIDSGLHVLASGCPNLRRLVLISTSVDGLLSVSQMCSKLQELEVHCCSDTSLKGISECKNLQILKLISFVEGFYRSVMSDIGLTIMAQGCKRLLKLELVGCEGSYDGIKAIGQCCQMLEELTLSEHRMDGGWLSALAYCGNLKIIKLQSCMTIDSNPGSDEHLGVCPTLEELQLHKCQMRDKDGVRALLLVCQDARKISFLDCWGLSNDVFCNASVCRRVKDFSLEGCRILTMEGLDSVILSWKELQRLRVVSCNGIKDCEVSPTMSSLFSVLKELKWRPDSRSILLSNLTGTGIRRKGGKFFKKA